MTPTPTRSLLPFDMPSIDVLRSKAPVFMHFFPPQPVSLDGKLAPNDYYGLNYYNAPHGENDKHIAYGTFMIDRPLPIDPTGTTWRDDNARREVRMAISAGLDGFALDMILLKDATDKNQWAQKVAICKAAAMEDPGFKIMLQPDMTALKTRTMEVVAAAVAELAAFGSLYKLADGRVVIAPYCIDLQPITWWQSFVALMKSTYSIDIALIAQFVNSETALIGPWSKICYAMGIWGSRTPQINDPAQTNATSQRGRIAAIKATGTKAMWPYAVQDMRRAKGVFDDSYNTLNLRNMWQIIREGQVDIAFGATWNDKAEMTAMEPTVNHGWTWLDINAYYLTWFKMGKAPEILRDGVYVSHRIQHSATQPTFPQTLLMKPRTSAPTRDMVEALVFLALPGKVTLSVGGVNTVVDAPAGVTPVLAPVGMGEVVVTVTRNGQTVLTHKSPAVITDKPQFQDLSYWGSGTVNRLTPVEVELGRLGTAVDTLTAQLAAMTATANTATASLAALQAQYDSAVRTINVFADSQTNTRAILNAQRAALQAVDGALAAVPWVNVTTG